VHYVASDPEWKFSRDPGSGWQGGGFDDSSWGFADAPSTGTCGSADPTPHIAEPIWAPGAVPGETVYFRRTFLLDTLPTSAQMLSVFEDQGDLYINGTLIRSDNTPAVEPVPYTDDITSLLHLGLNVAALRVTGGGCQSAQLLSAFVDPIQNVGLWVDADHAHAGLSQIPISAIPISALSSAPGVPSAGIAHMDLSASQLSSIQLSSILLSSIQLSSIQLSSIQLSSIPITRPGGWDAILLGTALEGVPLQDVTLGELAALNPPPAALSPSAVDPVTVGQVDLSATSLRSLSIAALVLGGTQLSSIAPPDAPDWCAELVVAGTSCAALGYTTGTIGSATLLALNLKGVQLSSIQLSSILLSSINLSASQLSSIQLSSIAVRDLQLSSIQLSSIPIESLSPGGTLASVQLSSIALPAGQTSWCDYFAAASGFTCAALGLDENSTLGSTVTAFALNGVSFASSPPSSIQLSSILLSSIAPDAMLLSSIPLDGVSINGTQLSSIQLSSIGINSSFLSSIQLSSIQLSSISPNASLLSSIQLSSISGFINCGLVNCATGTLGDAGDAGAILPGTTLGDIALAAGGFTLGDLGTYGAGSVQDLLTALGATPADIQFYLSFIYGDTTLGGVANGSPVNMGGVTFGQILLALLLRANYPWEDIPLDTLNAAGLNAAGDVLHYTGSFTFDGPPPAGPVMARVTLPDTFRYIAGSTTITVTDAHANVSTLQIEPSVSGMDVVWAIPGLVFGDQVQIAFAARPGLRLGIQTSSIEVAEPALPPAIKTLQAPVKILENFEPNDDPATAPIIVPDVLYLSHISSSTDKDFYRIAANFAAGTRLEVLLSHQAADNDVALFSPSSAQLRPSTQPPLGSLPLEDSPDLLGATPQPQTLQDVSLGTAQLSSIQLSSISTNRGTSDDAVSSSMPGTGGGYYAIEIGGYNGASSADPYVMRLRATAPPVAPQCSARTFATSEGVAGTKPASLDGSVQTLILIDEKRLGDTYGKAQADSVISALNALAARSDVHGAVIPVEGDAAVQTAYDAWDANPCSPEGANGVVAKINALVDFYRGSLPHLQNIVIAGSDDIVPFARVPDLTRVSNERDFAPDAIAIDGQNNAIVGSFVTGNVLTDNAYADFNPHTWLDHQLFIPQVAIGRLVETPDQMVRQVSQFINAGGQLDPSTALTTGYDFLADGAQQVAGALDGVVGAANQQRLINGTWTRTDLGNAFNGHTPVPDIASINAHFDQHRLLPGAGNTANDESDLYTSAEIARAPLAPTILDGRIIFSMGCHAGLNVPDVLVPSPNADQQQRIADWAQGFANQGAAVFVANTGYGYGDTDTVAYSEKLMAQFAQRFGQPMTIGQALTYAKQEYFGGLVQYEPYDEKVLEEATFYGLPMFRLAPPAVQSASASGAAALLSITATPTPLPFTTDGLTGFEGVALSATPTFTLVDLGAKGKYYSINGNVQVNSGRPVQPVFDQELPPGGSGKTARGIIVTGATSSDEGNFDAVFSEPSSDSSVPEVVNDGIFPESIHNLGSFIMPDGLHQTANFMPAQYIPDPALPTGIGIERRYTSLDAFVTYSNDPDVTPPTILQTHAALVGVNASFAVDAQDDQPDHVKAVIILYRPKSGSTWHRLDLVHTPSSLHWTGSAGGTGNVEYIVYAADLAGNVATSTNKGEFHQTVAVPPPYGMALIASGTSANAGWYSAVSVSAVAGTGVDVEVQVDGGGYGPYTGPVVISGPGVHIVEGRGSDGSSAGAIVALDAMAPTANIVSPGNGATYKRHQPLSASFGCADAGSGVASCVGDAANGASVDTSTSGPKTFHVSVTDVAGNAVVVSQPFTVSTCDFADTDCDGMLDTYEAAHPCLNALVADATADPDADGLTNAQEMGLGTDPCKADSDGDGYTDGKEVSIGKNPLIYCKAMRADVNNSGSVNSTDLMLVAQVFAQYPAPVRLDQNRDRHINAIDLMLVAQQFGVPISSCP